VRYHALLIAPGLTRNVGPAVGLIENSTFNEKRMTAKPPPVPPANRSSKGPGSSTAAPLSQGQGGSQTQNPDKVGQAGNSKVNTVHQGYQQDR
jgi:hypothetical protein